MLVHEYKCKKRKGRVIMKENKISFAEFLKGNKLVVSLFIALMLGIVFGCISFRGFTDNEASSMSIFAQDFIETKMNKSSSQMLVKAFLSGTLFLGICFVSGFCAVAQPAQFFILIIKGLGLGASAMQIYALKGFKGLLIIFLLVVPYALLTCFIFIIASKDAFRFSCKIFSQIFYKPYENDLRVFAKLYCYKYIFLEILIAISALIDWGCRVLFSGMLK